LRKHHAKFSPATQKAHSFSSVRQNYTDDLLWEQQRALRPNFFRATQNRHGRGLISHRLPRATRANQSFIFLPRRGWATSPFRVVFETWGHSLRISAQWRKSAAGDQTATTRSRCQLSSRKRFEPTVRRSQSCPVRGPEGGWGRHFPALGQKNSITPVNAAADVFAVKNLIHCFVPGGVERRSSAWPNIDYRRYFFKSSLSSGAGAFAPAPFAGGSCSGGSLLDGERAIDTGRSTASAGWRSARVPGAAGTVPALVCVRFRSGRRSTGPRGSGQDLALTLGTDPRGRRHRATE